MEINRNNNEIQLEVAINVLLESLTDKSQLVVDTINESIWKLSKRHSNEILKCCCKFYNNQTTTTIIEQQLFILNIMERICNENITEVDGDTVILINNFCIQIINNNNTNNNQEKQQLRATNILVAIGYQHHVELMEILIKNLQQQQPNRMILETLNKFSIMKPNGFVPYLKQIFNILLTTTTTTKNDDYRELLIRLIGNCCESLQEYLMNIESSNDQTITIDLYRTELNQFFDIVFNNWLQLHNKPIIIEQLLITLSKLILCVSNDKIEKNYLKIFELLLHLNQQKNKQQLSTSLIKLLLSLINKLIEINGQLIEQLLDRILIILKNFIIIDNNLDYEHDYLLLKQHNEVLRCYDCLNNYFTDTIIDHLLQQLNLNNHNDNNCLKSLIILTYLLQYSKHINQYLPKILYNIRHLLDNISGNKIGINRQLLKFVTILLLNRQIIEDIDQYLEFLLKLSYHYLNDSTIEVVELKKLIDNTLFLLITTVEDYDLKFWRLFVQYLIEIIDFNLINLRCLINLKSRLPQLQIDSDLFIRLLLVLIEPMVEYRGQFVLNFFKVCKFSENTQELSKYLENSDFNQQEWSDLLVDYILRLFNESSDDFRVMALQSSRDYLNKFDVNINNFLIKSIGVQLSCIKDAQLINLTLDYLLITTKFVDFSVINAYSECLGYSARQDLMIVIRKLQQFRQDYNQLKIKRFFKFTKTRLSSQLNHDNLRYLLLTSYIEICKEQLLTLDLFKLIETDILTLITVELTQQRRLCIRCLNLVADILHPNRNQLSVRLSKRDDLIKLLQQQFVLHEGSEFIELYPLILQTFLSLIRLPPVLQHEQIVNLLEQSFTNVFNASAIYLKLDSTNNSNKLTPIIWASFTDLYRLVRELFVQNSTINQLDLILELLVVKWLNLKKAEQRLPCIETVNILLTTYYDNYKLIQIGNCGKFDEIFGNLSGVLLRRLFDSNLKIRKFVLNSIYLLLCLIKRNNGIIINSDYDKQLMNQLQLIEQQLIDDNYHDFNINQQFYNNLIGDLINLFIINLNNHQLIYCLLKLIDGLLDYDLLCSYCCSLCLNFFIKSKGANLQQSYVEQIIENLLKIYINIKCLRTKQIVLKCILNFALHHPRIVSQLLLVQPLPYDQSLYFFSLSAVCVCEGSEFIELYPLILQTFLSLIRLPPVLQHEQIVNLLEQSFTNVFNASAIYLKLDSTNNSNKLTPIIWASFTDLYRLVRELFVQNSTINQLDLILELLVVKWLNLKKAEQRLPCIETLNILLTTYYDNYKLIQIGNCGKFDEIFGNLSGVLLRRLFDSNLKIRKFVLNSIYLLLCLIKRNNGIIINSDYDKQLMNQLKLIEQQLIDDNYHDFNINQQFYNNLIGDLINLFIINLNNHQLIYCLLKLIDGLLDYDLLCSYCCSLSLNFFIKSKGAILQQLYVEQIIENLLKIYINIKCLRTKQIVLKCILNFAIHHPRIVSQLLLVQPLPYDHVICECWAVLSTDTTLVIDLIDQFKKTIKQSQLYTLNENNKNIKIVNIQIYQILNVLNELLKNQQLKEICRQDFSELFSLLLIIIGTFIDTVLPTTTITTTLNVQQLLKIKPEKIVLDTLKQLLICCEYKQMANCLLLFQELTNNNNYNDYLLMIEKLVENLFIENYQSLSWLVANFGPYIRSDINIQRITVIYFFGQLVKNKLINQQQILAENLLEILLDVNLDQCYFVRKLALDGLGNAIDGLNFDLIQRHYQPILSVLMNSLDYNNIGQESDVILSGMLTFTKLLTILKGEKFSTCQVTTVVRIKPLFDQDDDNLRYASIHLFGDLTLSLNYNNNNNNGDNNHNNGNIEAFREQIHNNLITLLLHLNDSNLNVRKSCKYTLRHICQYLENTPKLNQMIQEHLIDDANLHYDNFIKDIIKIMAEELQDLFNLFIMTSLSYLKSQSYQIRYSAVLIIGLLYTNLLSENRNRISIDTIYDKLIRLLNDEHEDVRMKTIQSIAYLFVD